jgi:hypothetical protein
VDADFGEEFFGQDEQDLQDGEKHCSSAAYPPVAEGFKCKFKCRFKFKFKCKFKCRFK